MYIQESIEQKRPTDLRPPTEDKEGPPSSAPHTTPGEERQPKKEIHNSGKQLASSSADGTPGGTGHLVWNLNGKIVDVVVNGDDVSGLEPGYEPPPMPPAEMEQARCTALRNLGLDLHAQVSMTIHT